VAFITGHAKKTRWWTEKIIYQNENHTQQIKTKTNKLNPEQKSLKQIKIKSKQKMKTIKTD